MSNYSRILIKLLYGYEQPCYELTKLLFKSSVDILFISNGTSGQYGEVVTTKKFLGK